MSEKPLSGQWPLLPLTNPLAFWGSKHPCASLLNLGCDPKLAIPIDAILTLDTFAWAPTAFILAPINRLRRFRLLVFLCPCPSPAHLLMLVLLNLCSFFCLLEFALLVRHSRCLLSLEHLVRCLFIDRPFSLAPGSLLQSACICLWLQHWGSFLQSLG